MRTIWLSFCAISLTAAAVIWLFAAGWAGRIALLPDFGLLSSGERLLWLFGFVILWGPIGFAAWCGWRAVKEKNNSAAD